MTSSAEVLCFSENYVDITSVGDYKLAVYPNFLVLGKAVFDTKLQRIKFSTETSFKIQEFAFENWFEFLKNGLNLFKNKDEVNVLIHCEAAVQPNTNLEETTNTFYYCGKGPLPLEKRTIIITSTYGLTPFSFEFNFHQFQALCEAFSSLFFKIYCYTPVQNIIIDHFVQSTPLPGIQNRSLKELFQSITHLNYLDLTPSECLVIADLIVRHRNLLMKWRHFAVLSPRYRITEQ
jgi:hypothetical protein